MQHNPNFGKTNVLVSINRLYSNKTAFCCLGFGSNFFRTIFSRTIFSGPPFLPGPFIPEPFFSRTVFPTPVLFSALIGSCVVTVGMLTVGILVNKRSARVPLFWFSLLVVRHAVRKRCMLLHSSGTSFVWFSAKLLLCSIPYTDNASVITFDVNHIVS